MADITWDRRWPGWYHASLSGSTSQGRIIVGENIIINSISLPFATGHTQDGDPSIPDPYGSLIGYVTHTGVWSSTSDKASGAGEPLNSTITVNGVQSQNAIISHIAYIRQRSFLDPGAGYPSGGFMKSYPLVKYKFNTPLTLTTSPSDNVVSVNWGAISGASSILCVDITEAGGGEFENEITEFTFRLDKSPVEGGTPKFVYITPDGTYVMNVGVGTYVLPEGTELNSIYSNAATYWTSDGWSTSTDGTDRISLATNYPDFILTQNTTLVARYKQNPPTPPQKIRTISFNINTRKYIELKPPETDITLTAPTSISKVFPFSHWKEDGSGSLVMPYEPVYHNPQLGTLPWMQHVGVNDAVRPNYRFRGWSKSQSGPLVNPTDTLTDNLTLYARWAENEFIVS